MVKQYDTVIFDLDGTLLDTLGDLTDSVNAALDTYGFPRRSADEVRRFVGNGVARLVRLAVPPGTSEAVVSDCLRAFARFYNNNMRNKTAPYDGVTALLDELNGKGYNIAVVSNKSDAAVRQLCRDYFGRRIKAAYGEAPEMPRKPAPDLVIKALNALAGTADKAVYVGDSEVDAETAKNAGLQFVGVTWGFRDRDALECAGAELIIDRPDELLTLIEDKTPEP